MKPKQCMQVAAIVSALGLAGAAIANDMSTAPPPVDTPAASTGENPAADLGTNPDVNGGAGIDNPGGTRGNDSTRNDESSDVNGGAGIDNPGGTRGNDSTRNGESSDVNGQVDRSATQGGESISREPDSALDANAPGTNPPPTMQRSTPGRFGEGGTDVEHDGGHAATQ